MKRKLEQPSSSSDKLLNILGVCSIVVFVFGTATSVLAFIFFLVEDMRYAHVPITVRMCFDIVGFMIFAIALMLAPIIYLIESSSRLSKKRHDYLPFLLGNLGVIYGFGLIPLCYYGIPAYIKWITGVDSTLIDSSLYIYLEAFRLSILWNKLLELYTSWGVNAFIGKIVNAIVFIGAFFEGVNTLVKIYRKVKLYFKKARKTK